MLHICYIVDWKLTAFTLNSHFLCLGLSLERKHIYFNSISITRKLIKANWNLSYSLKSVSLAEIIKVYVSV